jgi:hypothetical protein
MCWFGKFLRDEQGEGFPDIFGGSHVVGDRGDCDNDCDRVRLVRSTT